MERETYRGVRLEVLRGRNTNIGGHSRLRVAGQEWGDWIGTDAEAHLRSMRATVDAAGERPEAYDPMWHPKS